MRRTIQSQIIAAVLSVVLLGLAVVSSPAQCADKDSYLGLNERTQENATEAAPI